MRPALACVFVGFPVTCDEVLLDELEDEVLVEVEVEVDVGGVLLLVVLLEVLLEDVVVLGEGLALAGLTFTESPLPPQAARPRGRASRVAVAAARLMTDMVAESSS